MSNQLLLGLQTTWINQVIVEGNIVNRVKENNVGYSFLLNIYIEFHRYGQDHVVHHFSDRHTQSFFYQRHKQ